MTDYDHRQTVILKYTRQMPLLKDNLLRQVALLKLLKCKNVSTYTATQIYNHVLKCFIFLFTTKMERKTEEIH